MVLEINTSGMDHIHRETYPHYKFFKYAYDKDIQILLGSDAHAPNQVARYFPKIIKYLKEVGYSQLVRFEKRKKQFVDL
jgi:histidinol-phosphatase (PHP family)